MAEYVWWGGGYDHLVLIGVQGALGAGKTTIRRVLVTEFGFKPVSMANPLKDALMAMGATRDEVHGKDKAEPNELWGGKTNRFAMQTLGTEWGRRTIHQDIWVECVRRQIDAAYQKHVKNKTKGYLASNPFRVVIDDVRFPNEAKMVRDFFGGTTWTVRRPAVEYAEIKQRILRKLGWWSGRLLGIHESERWWPMAPIDVEIMNNGTESQLVEVVKINYGAIYR